MWDTDTSGHGERAFLLLPVVVLGQFGLGSLLAGIALRYAWPGARRYSWLPFLLTAATLCAVWLGLV